MRDRISGPPATVRAPTAKSARNRWRLQLLQAQTLDEMAGLVIRAASALPDWSHPQLICGLSGEHKSATLVLPKSALSGEELLALARTLAAEPVSNEPIHLHGASQSATESLWLLPICGFPRRIELGWAALGLYLPAAERASEALKTPAARFLLRSLRAALPGALELARLRQRVDRLEAAERLQAALYAIADLASSELEMRQLLHEVHRIVSGLMYAQNFFIVLYDPDLQQLRFVYFADSEDHDAPDPEQPIAVAQLEHSLTLALIRLGRPLMGPTALLGRELGLPSLSELGPDAEDWLGVPLLSAGVVRGAVVVQSYDAQRRFSEQDRSLLGYVAQHILPTLERKQTQAELERRVEQRTRELRLQMLERERGERLQGSLFRIAELSSAQHSLAEFFAAVHAIVGELLSARNFFIALLTEDRQHLDFPYAVDEEDDEFKSRELRRGLTEYVLRSGQALLAMPEDSARLIAAGEVSRIGPMSACWLGVPLTHDGHVDGVLVMQSYTPDLVYTRADQDLLTFVSFHIANALERKRSQEALRSANTELNATLQRLLQTQHQLVESEKMASLGGLVAGVAHEINTPLSVGLTAASHLSEAARQLQQRLASGELRRAELNRFGETVVEGSELILRNLQRADQLVRSFKQVAVDHSVAEPRMVELGAAIAEILTMLGPALRQTPHRVSLQCVEPISLMLPGGVLYPIVSNLVINALLHAFPEGQVGHIGLAVCRQGQEIVLTCRDDGVGMSEAIRSKIFEPFFTTRRGQGGTGLGLHILYNLVFQVLHGSVTCTSSPGVGSCFEVRWPVSL